MTIDKILINKFKELKKNNKPESYVHIKNILANQILPITFTKYKPKILIRTRPHEENESFYTKIDDLNYNKNILNINYFGRANEPGQGLFYCNDKKNEVTGFAETMNVFRNNPNSFKETITQGAWCVDKELNLCIILPSEYKKVTSSIINSGVNTFNTINDNSDNFKELKNVLEFISEEFTINYKNDIPNYKITCAFVNYIKDNFPFIDGIIYASVKSDNIGELNGENIVLWEDVADQNLKLVGARKRTFKLINKDEFIETECFDAKEINHETGNIKW